MKYVVIIPDGAADHPLEELDGKTPFEVAKKPHTDRLSIEGRQGTVATTPRGMDCGSDVCTMSLLGYDPGRYHTGRAPLEAADGFCGGTLFSDRTGAARRVHRIRLKLLRES